MMNRIARMISIGVAIVALIGGLLWASAGKTAGQQLELVALKTATAPVLDGEVDQIWSRAKEVSIPVSGGANLPNGGTTVRMRALYTSDSIFIVHYEDKLAIIWNMSIKGFE